MLCRGDDLQAELSEKMRRSYSGKEDWKKKGKEAFFGHKDTYSFNNHDNLLHVCHVLGIDSCDVQRMSTEEHRDESMWPVQGIQRSQFC